MYIVTKYHCIVTSILSCLWPLTTWCNTYYLYDYATLHIENMYMYYVINMYYVIIVLLAMYVIIVNIIVI